MAADERRVVVVLDPYSTGSAVAAQAADLAVVLGRPLSGVFVEDSELIRAGRLPFSRLLHDTGVSRGIDSAAVETALRAAVTRARGELEAAARPGRLVFSFRVARGTVLGTLEQDASESDLIVVGSAMRTAPPASRPGVERPAPIAVVLDTPGSEDGLLDVVLAMVQAEGVPVRLIVPASAKPALLARVERWTRKLRGNARVDAIADFDWTSLAGRVTKERTRALLVSLGDPWLSETTLRALRRRLACPIILVR